MPGFLGIITRNNQLLEKETELDFYKFHKFVSVRKNRYENFLLYTFTNGKFSNDKVFFQNENYIIYLDGVILNLKNLKRNFAITKNVDLILYLYKKYGDEFYKLFRGEFCGIFYDKETNKYIVFTNHTGTKRVFYYHQKDTIIISSDLKFIIQVFKENKISYNLDRLGAYFILTYGFMLEEFTIITEIKKLKPGHYIKFENFEFERLSYHRFEIAEQISDSKDEIIHNLNDIFIDALKLEYDKDLEYGYKHIATLSAGLDSRMNVMLAHQFGYTDKLLITFSQSGYFDDVIPKAIARDLNENLFFLALDSARFLQNVEDNVWLNDGLVLYSGSSHYYDMTRKLNFDDLGLLHTGMLGDAVLGSYCSKPELVKPGIEHKLYSNRLIAKILNDIKYIENIYQTEEILLLYNRGFNGINNSYWINEFFTYQTSPFLGVEFLEYSVSIPPKHKFKQQIYIDWILSRHPDVARYIWENRICKLTDSKMQAILRKSFYRAKNQFTKIFDNSKWVPMNMNPFDFWYETKPTLKNYIDSYFHDHIDLLDIDAELKKDTIDLFENGTFGEKTQAITLIESIKRFFN